MKRQPKTTTIRFTQVFQETVTHVVRLRGHHEIPTGDIPRREFHRRLVATVNQLSRRTRSTRYYGGLGYLANNLATRELDTFEIEKLKKPPRGGVGIYTADLHPGEPPSITVDIPHAISHGVDLEFNTPDGTHDLRGTDPRGVPYAGRAKRYGNIVTVSWLRTDQVGLRFNQAYYRTDLLRDRQRALELAQRAPRKTKKAKPCVS